MVFDLHIMRNSNPRNSAPSRSRQPRPKKKGQVSSITDLSMLERKATPPAPEKKYIGQAVDSLPVDSRLKTNLSKKGYQTLTQIQDESLEPLLEGKDLMGIAQTGTGKLLPF